MYIFLAGKIKLKSPGEKLTKISTTKDKCFERKFVREEVHFNQIIQLIHFFFLFKIIYLLVLI